MNDLDESRNVFRQAVRRAQAVLADMPNDHAQVATNFAGSPHWPELDDVAIRGVLGDLVRAIEPHTEASVPALLIQSLIAFGSTLNRSAYFSVEADRHYMTLNAVLVGETAKGRKGTSWGYVHRVFAEVDRDWAATRVLSGLSSGEGLIWAVRDEITKEEPIKEKGRLTGEYQTVVIDPGIRDKRLLVLESEFAGTLRSMAREGNTLSAVIRQAFDHGGLRTLTKHAPAQATDAHISIVGHITKYELCQEMDVSSFSNGLCNRILWVCTRRSKLLSEGGLFNEQAIAPIIQRLHAAVQFGRATGEIKRDDAAKELWRMVYPDLSEGKPGLLGAVLSRAEALTMRLACLYALQDLSAVVRPEHLKAALGLWEFCEASARYIFGDRLNNPLADEVLLALRKHPAGMTRTQIRDWFGRNRKAHELDRALSLLGEQGLAWQEQCQSGGRPIEQWHAASMTTT